MSWRLQNSTGRVLFKAFLTGTDTPATGKTIPVVVSKNGGAFGNPNVGATNLTEIANGWYYFAPAAQDRDTLGPLQWRGTEGTIDPTEPPAELVVDAVRLGITALPNAAAEAAGGLYTRGSGAGQINQAANGQVDANAVAISGDSAAADNLEQAFDDAAGAVPWLGVVDQGTPQAASSGTTRLRAAFAGASDVVIGNVLAVHGSTQGYWQYREVTDFDGTTKDATHDPFTVTPTGTLTYKLLGGTPAPVTPPAVADSSGVTTLLSRLSSARAGYLDNLSAGAAALEASVQTLLTRITSSLFSGITSLAQWLGLIAGKQSGNATARTEIRATGAGSGTYDETTDAQEAIRDNMGTAQTGDAFARLGAPAGASVSADIADLPTNAELTTALGTADDAVLAAIAALNNLSQANIRTALGMASANFDTQIGDLPTNAELATALGTADDATLAAIAALNNLSSAQVTTVLTSFFGVVTGTVSTAASATSLTLVETVGTDVRKGILRLTSGDLAGESCLVSWTGTTVTVLSQTSMPTALKQFSATPANGVTYTFMPL